MKHAVESGSGAMTYIPSFIKIGSGFQKSIHRNSMLNLYTCCYCRIMVSISATVSLFRLNASERIIKFQVFEKIAFKMEAAGSSETLVPVYQTTRCGILEGLAI
jgi:hypothetical protein